MGDIHWKKCNESDLLLGKSVIAYSGNNYYILSGTILFITLILYLKWYSQYIWLNSIMSSI
jgi:hypothetical protein